MHTYLCSSVQVKTYLPVVSVDVCIYHGAAGPVVTKQVEPIDCLQCCLGHSNAAGVHLRVAIIVLGASTPSAKVWCPVCPLNIIDKVLNQSHLLHAVYDFQSRRDHLN